VASRPHATSVAGESQQDSQMVFMVCRRLVVSGARGGVFRTARNASE
jgi:hypothetical protein